MYFCNIFIMSIMKTIQYFLIIAVLFIQSIFSIQAQSTAGKEFWLTFSTLGWDSGAPPSSVDIQIRIVGGISSTTGTIFFTNLGKKIDFAIQANKIYDYSLNNLEKEAVFNTVMGKNNKSIHIMTSNPVTVYSFIQGGGQFADATIVYPVTALGTEYYQISHMQYPSYSADEAYAVVATQNNTRVFHENNLVEILQAGEVYYRLSKTDMSGKYITSDAPVAFFALNRATAIPEGGYISNLMEHLAPVNTWGKTFFVPVSKFGKEIVRIIVSKSGTNILQTGGTIRTAAGGQPLLTNLLAGQYVDLEIFLSNNGCYIEADKPVGVCSFMESGIESVPSQSWIPGIEQTVSKAQIAPFIPTGSTKLTLHYALIITETATKNNTLVSVG